jgi:PST family polysaccharide transporter
MGKFEPSSGLLKILNNIGWLFIDKILRMGVGIIVSVWVARYLGPEQFGILNFALAFTGLFGTIATLGLTEIMVRDLVIHPQNAQVTLGTGFVLRLIGGLVAFLLTICVISYLRPDDTLIKIIVAILGFSMIINFSEVVACWFESRIESKFVVWIQNGVFLIIAAVKVGMLLMHAPLIAFVLATFVETILVAVALLVFYSWKVGRLTAWIPCKIKAKKLLRDSWPLIFSGLAISVYMKIDQVMLGQMLGNESVGIYSAAVRISEVWYFIPGVIVTSVFPAIIAAKKRSEEQYYKVLQNLYSLMLWISLIAALTVTILGDWIINFLFGIKYIEAISVLKIHIWTGVNVAIGAAWSKWILIENKQKLVLYGHILGSILNILLNLFLIKSMGINGAAWSTFLSGWISALFIYTIYRPKKSFELIIKSFNIIKIINGIKRNY